MLLLRLKRKKRKLQKGKHLSPAFKDASPAVKKRKKKEKCKKENTCLPLRNKQLIMIYSSFVSKYSK
jgi:hypothetical protein